MGCLRKLILSASTCNLFCKKNKLNTLFDGFNCITFDGVALSFLKMLARSSFKGGISIMVAPEVIAVEINEWFSWVKLFTHNKNIYLEQIHIQTF